MASADSLATYAAYAPAPYATAASYSTTPLTTTYTTPAYSMGSYLPPQTPQYVASPAYSSAFS